MAGSIKGLKLWKGWKENPTFTLISPADQRLCEIYLGIMSYLLYYVLFSFTVSRGPCGSFYLQDLGIFLYRKCEWVNASVEHRDKMLDLDSSVHPYFITSWSIGFMARRFMGTCFYGKAQWHVISIKFSQCFFTWFTTLQGMNQAHGIILNLFLTRKYSVGFFIYGVCHCIII